MRFYFFSIAIRKYVFFNSKWLHYSSNEWREVYQTDFNGEIFKKNTVYSDITGDFYVQDVYLSNLGNNGVMGPL